MSVKSSLVKDSLEVIGVLSSGVSSSDVLLRGSWVRILGIVC